MLNDGPQLGDPGELPSDPQQVIAALNFQLSSDLCQRSLDLLHNLTGGPDLPNLKTHSGPNLSTAPNSYKELTGLIAGTFSLLQHSRTTIQKLADALSKRGPPSTDGSNDSPPAWLTHFTTTQNRIFESFKNDINDRLSKQEQKLENLYEPTFLYAKLYLE